jgi:DpnD/PcfM-like protein
MKTYCVRVTSTFTQTVLVEAENEDEAKEKASDDFYSGDLHDHFESVADTLEIKIEE